MIPLFIDNIRCGRPLPVYGTGQNIRDWLYVGDHARALDTVFHNAQNGETYNIGGNNEWTNIDLVKELIRVVDSELGNPEGYSDRLITYVEDRAGHDLRYAIDTTKIERDLAWHAETTFETGLRRTIRWYLNNRPWVEEALGRK